MVEVSKEEKKSSKTDNFKKINRKKHQKDFSESKKDEESNKPKVTTLKGSNHLLSNNSDVTPVVNIIKGEKVKDFDSKDAFPSLL